MRPEFFLLLIYLLIIVGVILVGRVLLIQAVRIIYRTWAQMKREEHNQ